MQAVVMAVVTSLASLVRSRMALQIEILALRHQLTVYQRVGHRPRLRAADRLLWAWRSRTWSGWREVLVIVQPRNRDHLAAQTLPRLLDAPESAGPPRPPCRHQGDSGSDPQAIGSVPAVRHVTQGF
jgi:hypothetical protein